MFPNRNYASRQPTHDPYSVAEAGGLNSFQESLSMRQNAAASSSAIRPLINAYGAVNTPAQATQRVNDALGMPGLSYPCNAAVRQIGHYATAMELEKRQDEAFGYAELNDDGTVNRTPNISEKALKITKYVMATVNVTEVLKLGQLAYKFYTSPTSLTDNDFKLFLNTMMTLTVHTGVRQQAGYMLDMLAQSRQHPPIEVTPENREQLNRDLLDAQVVLNHFKDAPPQSAAAVNDYLEAFLNYGVSLFYLANMR